MFLYSTFQVEFMKMYDAILRKLYELCVTKCVTECVFLLVGATRALSFSCHSRVDGKR